MHQVASKSRINTIVVDGDCVQIPAWVTDLESFRRWAQSDDFPEKVPVSFLGGEVWLDMSREQFAHNQIKGAVAAALIELVNQADLGTYFSDGYLLSNPAADLTTKPDGMFASTDSFRSGRVRLIEGAQDGYLELEGSPDMVLEVISRSSVRKDLTLLPELYWRAGVSEYWIIDPRSDPVGFTLLHRGPSDFVPLSDQAGWAASNVFNQSFRMAQLTNSLGLARFQLERR